MIRAPHQDSTQDDQACAGTAEPAVWLFDLGNTRVKYAPLQADGSLGNVHAIAHDGENFDAGWDTALPARCAAAHVASVAAPALRVQLLDALTRRCGRIVRPCTLPTLAGLRIAYADPASLGVDRFLAMLGARMRGPGPWLVVGVGTALTIDLVDADGQHRGGRIAPSPALMRASLHGRAAQLPQTGGMLRDFADTTADALRSGCDGAALALIERARADAAALLGRAPQLLMHGGGTAALAQTPASAQTADSLVLEGMAVWAAAMQTSTLAPTPVQALNTMSAC